ncbi:MAG: translesion DNA synthesis-associated protein ImuA [Rubrivivax sp.]|nr:MAG: translesion DNA synthesis-associated protein ImuA [Rubrivivax sp.]
MLFTAANAPATPLPTSHQARARLSLDPHLESRLWRGTSLGRSAEPTLSSGFAALDAELPGGGWPRQAATELLTAQFGVLEWRLLVHGLRDWWGAQALPAPSAGRRQRTAAPSLRSLLLVNPPHTPHLPGLQALGLPPSALVWVSVATPAEALWATEQAIKSRVAVLAWLAEARPEQIRRLQVSALGSDAPVFLVRPERVSQQSSAAPLRLIVRPGEGWSLDVHLLKRRGPAHEGWLQLPAVPGSVEPLLTAAKRKPLLPPAPEPSPTPVSPPVSPSVTPSVSSSVSLLIERSHAMDRPVLHA